MDLHKTIKNYLAIFKIKKQLRKKLDYETFLMLAEQLEKLEAEKRGKE